MTAPRYRRSPFLVFYWSGSSVVVLNANSLAAHPIHPQLVALLSELSDWRCADELEGLIEADELRNLHGLGLLETDADAALRNGARFEWDSIELAVQRRTATGGYWPDLLQGDPITIQPRFFDRPATELPQPVRALPITLTEALERRRTMRTFAACALRLQDVSTLLYHCARPLDHKHDQQLGDTILRPYPTAGARSELEIYLVAVDIEGVDAGAFYYDSAGHRLLRLRAPDDRYALIVQSVKRAAGGQFSRDPPMILVITAVFERILWKYRSLGLSLIYKDVGALFQTLYLVATALHMAPCAIGSADEAENSRWLGLDPMRESQVGCFACGPAAVKEHREC